jgi:hypothetical protein
MQLIDFTRFKNLVFLNYFLLKYTIKNTLMKLNTNLMLECLFETSNSIKNKQKPIIIDQHKSTRYTYNSSHEFYLF